MRIAASVLVAGAAFTASAQAPAQDLAVAEIVAKNAAARGGVDAWSRIQTMVWSGHVESGNATASKLPFLLEQKRPNRTRFEILAEGQKSVRLYDGSNGWKVRPSSDGRPQTQAYSDEELKFARGAQVIDGPLMDYAARGAAITLGGTGEFEGHRAYVLDIRLPSGGLRRVWVDAGTFVEVRHDREVRGASGSATQVTTLYRDYRPFDGLLIPMIIEAAAATGTPANKIVIEKVALNPDLDDAVFARPASFLRRGSGVTVDTRSTATAGPSRQAPRQ